MQTVDRNWPLRLWRGDVPLPIVFWGGLVALALFTWTLRAGDFELEWLLERFNSTYPTIVSALIF